MANITQGAAVFVSNDGGSNIIDCRGSNLLNPSKITLDAVSTALVESTFQDSAISAVKHAVAYPLSSSDIALEFNQLAISTPGCHYNQRINQQKPGTVITNAINLSHLNLKNFSCRSIWEVSCFVTIQRTEKWLRRGRIEGGKFKCP